MGNGNSNNINKVLIAIIVFVALGLIGKFFNRINHDDNKCDICGKRATYSTSSEEYCDKHLKSAVEWYIKQNNK